MLDDRALLTLKAFLAAYESQGQPVIPELAEIWSDLENRVNDLDDLAWSHPQLGPAYRQACTLLTTAASTRKASGDDFPEEDEDDDNRELRNMVRRYDRKNLDELKQSFNF